MVKTTSTMVDRLVEYFSEKINAEFWDIPCFKNNFTLQTLKAYLVQRGVVLPVRNVDLVDDYI